ncbi:MAG: hypothetical protein VYE64_11190 [Planctomycetota bacterium]|nr:hypothetical protein [Planctomycetota bacterium]
MSQESTNQGYCSRCKKNAFFTRVGGSRLANWRERLTLKLSRLAGPPVWRCDQCGHRLRFLARCRKAAEKEAVADFTTTIQEDGNFIRRDLSLVLQKQRSARFSQKYRDGIVQRLMSGTATPHQVSRELEVRESDLMAWIADLLDRRDEQIRFLTQQVTDPSQRTSSPHTASTLNGIQKIQTVEGHARNAKKNGDTATG